MSSIEVARDSTRGSLILVIGNVLSTAFTAIATVIVARLLGPEGYGLYTLAFVAPSIFLQFLGFGVNLAVTRYAALYLSKGEVNRAIQITRRATIFLLLFGVALALANYYAAQYVSEILLRRTTLATYTPLTSIFILAQAATQASGNAFVGWSSMRENSAFQILQAVVRLAISPVLILLGFGVYGAVLGNIASYVVQGGSAILTLYALKLRSYTKTGVGFFDDVKTMVRYGLPAFAGYIASGLAGRYLTILLASVVVNTVVGNYQAATNVAVAISITSDAVSTVLIRSFATLEGLRADLAQAFDYAIRYVSFLLTPVVVFLFASAGVLFDILYSSFYSGGVILLQLTAVSYLPVAFGLTVLPSFLYGVGYSRFTLFTHMMGALSVVVAGPIFVIWLGLGAEGVIYAILVSNVTATVLGLFLSSRYIHARISIHPLLGILAAAIVSLMVAQFVAAMMLSPFALLAIEIIVFVVTYLTCVPLFRGIDFDDLGRLKMSIEGIRFLGPIMSPILKYERWILVKSNARQHS